MLTRGLAVPNIDNVIAFSTDGDAADWRTRDTSTEGASIRVLVVDDDESIRSVCTQILIRNNAESVCVSTLADAETMLRNHSFDLLLLDMKLPDGSGISLLKQVKLHYSDMAVVVMTAFATVSSAVEAMRIGASDYITKPFAMEELTTILEGARQRARFSHQRSVLRARLRSQDTENELIGRSAEMEKLHRLLAKVTFSTHPVLILGEHGTGKDVVARSIHFNGPNADRPFVAVNCSSDQIERELFGDDHSATDGDAMNGVLTAAEGGTVCLDEIGELPLDLQAKLLRTLQEKKVLPLGATHAKSISTRILASSTRDLVSMVEQGKFRKDLFFRLNVMSLKTTPLRQRREDISLLAIHFLAVRDKRDGVERRMSEDVLNLLEKHSWPGNVRELENAIAHACALSDGPFITVADLPSHLDHRELAIDEQAIQSNSAVAAEDYIEVAVPQMGKIMPIAEIEKQAILGTIDQLGGDKVMAAKLLGIGKTTLYRKLKEYEVIHVDVVPATSA